MNKIPIVVTGVGGGGYGRQVMKALRLASAHYKIIATDMSPLSYGLYEADEHYLVPSAESPQYIDSLIRICRLENTKVLIPGSEPELLVLTRNLSRLKQEDLIPLTNSVKVINICMDKHKLFNFLARNKIPCPRFKAILTESDVLDINYYPVVVKPSRNSGGSNMVFLAQDTEELTFFSSYLRKYGYEPLVQEYVGSHQDEYTIGILSIEGGEVLGSFALRRNITSGLSRRCILKDKKKGNMLVISSGISQGAVDEFHNIRKQAEHIASALQSQGPLNVQGRIVGDQLYVFEINPRFSGTTSIRALMGWNEPDILIKYYLFGEKPKQCSYRYGYVLRDLSEKFISFDLMANLSKES